MREQLLGYLLHALDDDERREVEQKLATDERWGAELADLRSLLEPLSATYEEFEPPADLAERTCALVHEHATAVEAAAEGLARSRHAAQLPPLSAPWSLADLVVAVGVCIVAALLFLPAISNSRYLSRRILCQNNLQQVGVALTRYSDLDGSGYFPAVASFGRRAYAGIYASILLEAGLLTDPDVVVCPASPQATVEQAVRIPTLEEVDETLVNPGLQLQDHAKGMYGYNLGVMVDGKHLPPRNQGRDFFALMSDEPDFFTSSQPNIDHAGRGLNVLFEDGHVSFCDMRQARLLYQDDPFRNRRGIVEVGLDENDAVIGRSITSPFPRIVWTHDTRP
jgi:prepilin-type processing-associated H-X9-DG protein